MWRFRLEARWYAINALLSAILVSGAPWAVSIAGDAQRRFEVRDSVEMSEFTEGGIFSPDGRYFVAVSERGSLPAGVTEATIWLFESSAVRQSVDAKRAVAPIVPVVLARLTAAINGGEYSASGTLITRLTWEPDSENLLFLGHDGRENRQLFRVHLSDRKMTALTPPTQDVVDYGTGAGNIVYFAGPEVSSEKLWWSVDPSAPDIVAGTGQPLMHLLCGAFTRRCAIRANPLSCNTFAAASTTSRSRSRSSPTRKCSLTGSTSG